MFHFSKVEMRKTRLKLEKLFEATALCSENCEWGAIVSLFRLFFFHLKISKRMKLFFATCVNLAPWTCFQLSDIFDIFDICELLKNPNLWNCQLKFNSKQCSHSWYLSEISSTSAKQISEAKWKGLNSKYGFPNTHPTYQSHHANTT